MKKFYVTPEFEEVILNAHMPLLAGSTETEDITDGPTPVIEDPTDDDLDW